MLLLLLLVVVVVVVVFWLFWLFCSTSSSRQFTSESAVCSSALEFRLFSGNLTFGKGQLGSALMRSLQISMTEDFWVLPLTYLYLPKSPKSARAQSGKNHNFCSGPVSVEPICPQPRHALPVYCRVLRVPRVFFPRAKDHYVTCMPWSWSIEQSIPTLHDVPLHTAYILLHHAGVEFSSWGGSL